MTSPEATLKTVLRRAGFLAWLSEGAAAGLLVVAGGGGGGGTENRARSWVSVSRMREVMSWLARRAVVKILGGGKLGSWRSRISMMQCISQLVRLTTSVQRYIR